MTKDHLKYLGIPLLISILTITGLLSSGNLISEKKFEVKNLNQTKNSVALTKVIEYDTVKTYNKKIPTGVTITKEKGHNGLAYIDENNNTQIIESPKNAEIEIGTGDKADYVGKMTGYGADCIGCSGNGTLACKTKNGTYHSLKKDGMTYNDDEYGNVRIIAASLDKFPCGTIIKVDNPNLGTFNAIVLDTGGAMKSAWENGIVHMDLAYVTETDPAIHLSTSSNVKYSVQRWGF